MLPRLVQLTRGPKRPSLTLRPLASRISGSSATARRNFYVRTNKDDSGPTESLSGLETLENGLHQLKLELSQSADQRALTSELSQLRRARDMLTTTLKDLEGIVAAEHQGSGHFVPKGSSEENFHPVFHSSHDAIYSPLNGNEPAAVQNSTSEAHHPPSTDSRDSSKMSYSYSIEDRMVDSVTTGISGAPCQVADRPELLQGTATKMWGELHNPPAADASDRSTTLSPKVATNADNVHTHQTLVSEKFAGAATSKQELWEPDVVYDAINTGEGPGSFEPAISGTEYTNVATVSDCHRSL
ncbi:hypothetical protein IWQ62_001329 [Dispira parvispora]|uniref:Uncharacterized protein n=1 Tax=Dispira parvispora TaxID=1520584 RepID=A0A9W8E966_9FUNG|nr:hypothetical protein IWQ62_001329 [Dispira parvispora]